MVKISNTLGIDFTKQGNFFYGSAGTDAIAYTHPPLWSSQMPVGLVAIMPHDAGADKLLGRLDNLQKWVYTLRMPLVQDLRVDDRAKNLEAARFLNDEQHRRFEGQAWYMLYFVGEKSASGEVYGIPSSIVLASGHNPKMFTHEVLLYLLGKPVIAVSREKGKVKQVEITTAQALEELNGVLRGKYEKPLSAVKIEVTGHKSGLVIHVHGIKPRKKQGPLEQIASH